MQHISAVELTLFLSMLLWRLPCLGSAEMLATGKKGLSLHDVSTDPNLAGDTIRGDRMS